MTRLTWVTADHWPVWSLPFSSFDHPVSEPVTIISARDACASENTLSGIWMVLEPFPLSSSACHGQLSQPLKVLFQMKIMKLYLYWLDPLSTQLNFDFLCDTLGKIIYRQGDINWHSRDALHTARCTFFFLKSRTPYRWPKRRLIAFHKLPEF